MKKVLLFTSLFTIPFAFGQSNNLSQNSITEVMGSLGSSLGTQEVFRFKTGAITQLNQGSNFDFGLNNQWMSLGQVDAGSQVFYGSRFQYRESAFVTGYTDASPAKPRIQWIHNGGSTARNLEFRVGRGFGSPNNPQVNILVASMTPLNGNTYFGENIDTSNPFGDDPADSPKVGIDTQFGQKGFSIRSVNQTSLGAPNIGAEITVEHLDFGTGMIIAVNGNQSSTGIFVDASSSQNSIGVLGKTHPNTQFSAAIYGDAQASGNNRHAGYFNGDVVTTAGAFLPSDEKLKNNINNEKSALERISQLRPVTYSYNKTDGIALPETNQHGFISQEMAEVFPELTKDVTQPIFDENGKIASDISYKAINYTGLISVLTAGIQELNTELVNEIASVREELTTVSEELAEYKANDKIRQSLVQDSREVSDYAMEQNIPNPFNDRTVIRYQLAAEVNQASITIFNLNGGFVKDYPINENKGEVTVLASEIGKGMFIYSLTRNGQEIMSKRMIVR
ncbi:tail fiber domain-containing protein [Brumimicrobium oceani]|uniref:Peptidase S74 domain-containing protein n=1 Tax=Brumimicrobium oceani TaxID=2100725 RepID=A0A2U2XB53_9FLAO|nr:tail fiber domain-containing protein [Brumimicrobium oceani]PWH84993.1 hypothetical protein DIT68_11510 [Brumimicrobium oceani]